MLAYLVVAVVVVVAAWDLYGFHCYCRCYCPLIYYSLAAAVDVAVDVVVAWDLYILLYYYYYYRRRNGRHPWLHVVAARLASIAFAFVVAEKLGGRFGVVGG